MTTPPAIVAGQLAPDLMTERREQLGGKGGGDAFVAALTPRG